MKQNRNQGNEIKSRYPPNFSNQLALLGGLLVTVGDVLATFGVAVDIEQSQIEEANLAQQSQNQDQQLIALQDQLKALEKEVHLLKSRK